MNKELTTSLEASIATGQQWVQMWGEYVTGAVDAFDDDNGGYGQAVLDLLEGAMDLATGTALVARGAAEAVAAFVGGSTTTPPPGNAHDFTATKRAPGGGRRVLKLQKDLKAILGTDSLPVAEVTITPSVLDNTDTFAVSFDGIGHAGLTYTGDVVVTEEATGLRLESVEVWVIIP